jgi:diguanylate cyclase (GGDEF)-like protein/PAS domain S-box-containing protein
MIDAARARGWPLIASAVLVGTLLLRSTGLLEPLDNAAGDARDGLLQHTVESDIVIVGIDATSLADLQQWPWPRRYHARVLERLAEARPAQVFIDIDFSSRSTPEDDAQLAAALASFTSPPATLPVFAQDPIDDSQQQTATRPLPEFAAHARLASVNFKPARDGLVREFRTAWDFDGEIVPAAASTVSGSSAADGPSRPMKIDYSISPASFEFISFVDVLAGRVSPEDLRGKTILIGATALELNDLLPVPGNDNQMKPGIVVQALAAQTLRGTPIRTLPNWMYVLVLATFSTGAAFVFARRDWRSNLAITLGCALTIALLALAAYSSYRVVLDVAAPLLVFVSTFLIVTVRSLDQETWRSLAYAIGIRRRDALLGSIVESSTDGIVCVNRNGLVEMANAAGARLFGCEPGDLRRASISRFVPALGAMDGLAGRVTEHDAYRVDGSEFPVEVSVSRVPLEDETLHTVMIRDITERKEQERLLRHQATHDPLTSLPNRVALGQQLDTALSHATEDRPVMLLMLDLCRFKEVNDTLGHDVGDRVLCEVARRFATVCPSGCVARIGGDEFTMVLDSMRDRDAVRNVAAALNERLRIPIETNGIAIDVGVSIGVAVCPDDAPDAATLLRHADVAMYMSKRRGSAIEFYDAAADQNSVRRLAMVSELRSAIGAGQLNLYYQPQVNLRTNHAESVEALLRWRHPGHGMVSPADFIAVAESTDLIRPLTEWTLHQAMLQAAGWRAAGFLPRIAVNLSARVLQDVEFPARLRAMLAAHEANPMQLELEITESAMMLDPARAMRVVREIHALGVFLSIDDFGTGYSSLGYLRELPVHALKLDKSFVQHLQARAEDRSIVNSTVRLAHELRLQVVAEGVETEWVARYLAEAGYDYAQGYLYSPALPAEDCRRWMSAFNDERRRVVNG